MNNSDTSGALLATLILISSVAAWVTSAIAAWNLIEPNNFIQAILFLFVWNIFAKIFESVFTIVAVVISSILK